jgi:hypothetical protein
LSRRPKAGADKSPHISFIPIIRLTPLRMPTAWEKRTARVPAGTILNAGESKRFNSRIEMPVEDMAGLDESIRCRAD